jgi:small nuclear ribonucleoprotein (snRNP)-like protein
MGTRQLRISDREQVNNTIKEYVGKSITVVLKDKTALFGLLYAVNDQTIVLKNMRLQKCRYALDQIDELYIDAKT